MANKFYLLWDIYFLNTYEDEKKLKTPERTNGLMKSSKGKKRNERNMPQGIYHTLKQELALGERKSFFKWVLLTLLSYENQENWLEVEFS